MEYFVGVDVGTGSVRAALVSEDGNTLSFSSHPIETFNPQQEFYEQSSNNIWNAVCHVVKVSFNLLGNFVFFSIYFMYFL